MSKTYKDMRPDTAYKLATRREVRTNAQALRAEYEAFEGLEHSPLPKVREDDLMTLLSFHSYLRTLL